METDACLALIAERFPSLLPDDRHKIEINTDGWSSLVLDIKDTFIFRFPRRPEIIAGFKKEAALLPNLAKALTVSIPVYEFLCLDEPNYRRCFVGYRKIHGVAWSTGFARSPQITGQIANFLSELHHFPTEKAARLLGLQASPQVWRQRYLDFYTWIQNNAFQLLEKPVRNRATQAWETYLDNEDNFRFRPSLIHADLCDDHILCDPERQQLNGIIDWEDATLGDPALDFVGLAYIAGWEPVKRVLSAYRGPVEGTFRQRIAFYLGAIPFHQIFIGLQTGNQNHIREGVDALSRPQSWQGESPW